MDYNSHIKRTLISFFQFMSLALWFVYLWFNLFSFADAVGKYIKAASFYKSIPLIVFFAYSIALVFLPVVIIYMPRRSRHSKTRLFKLVTYTIAAILLIGAISDLWLYKFFIGYEFQQGDPIFCNLITYLRNIWGSVCCIVMAIAYVLFGKYLTKNRLIAYLLYMLILLLELVPLVLTHYNGTLYQALMEKAALILPHQISLFISLTLAFPSEILWTERIK